MKLGPSRPRPEEPEYPFQGSILYQGITIDVETAKGRSRRGVDPSGKAWSVVMPAHYGEVRGTIAADGDALDVFVGDDPYAPWVYVIQAKVPGTKSFDETKCMLGFPSQAAAVAAFRTAYNSGGFFGGVKRWPIGSFKAALTRPRLLVGQMKRPLIKGTRLVMRLARMDRGEPKTDPGELGGDQGEFTPHRVKFRHPSSGEARHGTVHAGGAKGVTVVDGDTGEAHKVEHGHYARHREDHPSQEEAANVGKMPEHEEEAAKRLEAMFAEADKQTQGKPEEPEDNKPDKPDEKPECDCQKGGHFGDIQSAWM